MPRFPEYQADLRRSSNVEFRFPFADRKVTLLRIAASGVITQASTLTEKRAMVREVTGKDVLLAAWPGEWSQDVFLVDDLDAARTILA